MTIQERIAKIRFFEVKPDFSSLDTTQRQALAHCVNASRVMTDIYLEQVYADNKRIYRELQKRNDAEGKDLLRYFLIHGSPWDAYDHDRPFIPGVGEKPKFGSFYPSDLTRDEWDAWLNARPKDRERFESNYTVIRRQNNGLIARPYSEEYADQLNEAANLLRQAAALLPNSSLRSFLQLRANAFLSNDYFESDMALVDTDGNPFEVTIGPYEVYFDAMLGLKASFESFVALPDKDATAALAQFTPVVPDFDAILSEEFNFHPKGAAIPLEVVADVIRGGEAGFGYMSVAYNLPNDRRVHDLKGSKKVFSRTMMEAKFYTEVLPVAERILPAHLVELCNFENLFKFVLGHELAHGLGPSKIRVGDREMPFEVALKDLYSSLEEAKADTLGIRLLNYFRSRNILNDETLAGIVVTEIAAHFRQWRHGFTEAHSRGELIEYNWLKAANALRYDTTMKKYEIDPERYVDAMSLLSTEFLNLQVAGDYERAKAFMEHWGFVPSELPPIIESLSDIPTAVNPIWDLSELQ
ncbi:MAG: hypothetical protein A2939_03240 [Parcubacteria group bacterium RIFCSPLOWO2_01_FULL_48_18]|nr:MAG: hypothetical protein A2939_03240 [Parcubacteria group bacterium RIFCSPLOWO2_01_FULL_48_18]